MCSIQYVHCTVCKRVCSVLCCVLYDLFTVQCSCCAMCNVQCAVSSVQRGGALGQANDTHTESLSCLIVAAVEKSSSSSSSLISSLVLLDLVSKQDKSGLEKLVTFVELDSTLGRTICTAWYIKGSISSKCCHLI